MTRPILDADYAAIEARIVAWLAGQEDALDEYRQGVDRYKRMAAFVYGIPEAEVNKFPQRFVGKGLILGAGFGLGADKFQESCLEPPGNYAIPLSLAVRAINQWRKKHPKIEDFWDIISYAAKGAILHKGTVYQAGEFLSFKCITTGGIEFLLMKLPSGRKLSYPWPKIVPGKYPGKTNVSFFEKLKGTKWGHNRGIWGGVFTENATQAVAADIMCHGAQRAEDGGYEIAALIHDQALAYWKEGQTPEEFVERLTDLPEWAENLPIAAEGALVPFYKKD